MVIVAIDLEISCARISFVDVEKLTGGRIGINHEVERHALQLLGTFLGTGVCCLADCCSLRN